MKLNERLVAITLTKLGLVHKRETSIGELDEHFNHNADQYSKRLRFDFYVPEKNLVIEFDGEQHFNVVDYFGGLGSFMHTHSNDMLKIRYCKERSINMIRMHHNSTTEDLERALLLFDKLEEQPFKIITYKEGVYNVDYDKEIPSEAYDIVEYFQREIEKHLETIESLEREIAYLNEYYL